MAVLSEDKRFVIEEGLCFSSTSLLNDLDDLKMNQKFVFHTPNLLPLTD